MDNIKVAIFQIDIAWVSPSKNRKHIEEFVENSAKDADIIILPEMFTTGFTMEPEKYAEENTGESVEWLKECAVKYKKAFCGSICVHAEQINGEKGYFNRLYFITEDATTLCYDKRHLFRMAKEHDHYTAGHSKQIIYYKGFKILPLICYDLRFPVWSRNVRNGYDLLIYIASWPDVRRDAWSALLKARAIENMSYCIGVNRTGEDHSGLKYSGDSVALDFKGVPIWSATPYKEEVYTVTLDKKSLEEFREKFPAHLDADQFSVYE